MILYHMTIVFDIDITPASMHEMMEKLGEPSPVLQKAGQIIIEQTVPFVPDENTLREYAEAIKTQKKLGDDIIIQDVRFAYYKEFSVKEVVGLTTERCKQLLFQTIQLARQNRVKTYTDAKDFDDWYFSELDMEIQELEEIYEPYGVSVYGSSCFETNQSPKDFDRKYFVN